MTLENSALSSTREPLCRSALAISANENATSELREQNIEENPWGYAKRLRYIRQAIVGEFPNVPRASVRILDVGCGNGSFVAIPLARSGFQVVGIDVHQESIDHARILAEKTPTANFLVRDVTDLQHAPFDVIILSEVLEHVREPKSLLLDSLRHLKRNGIMIVTTPNGYGGFELDSWVYRHLRLEKVVDLIKTITRRGSRYPATSQTTEALGATDNLDSGHVQFFRRSVLRRLFADCSLTIAGESAGAFLCGPLVCHTLGRSRWFIDWNVRVSNKLPLVLSSSWYFTLRRA